MNKNEGTTEFINELETTGRFEILNNKEEDELHKKLEKEYGHQLSEFVKQMKANGFSDFVIGVRVGIDAATNAKKISTRMRRFDWNRIKPRMPEIFKKTENEEDELEEVK